MSKPIDFSSRTKTFMSQMTDKTPRFNNTTTTIRTKDFTNTHIDVSTDRGNEDGRDYSNSLTEKKMEAAASDKRQVAELPINNSFDEEESAVFDDWSDEVSELSGIGNDERAVMKKLLIGRSSKRSTKSGGRDTRAVS
jgi:hypothetical protein